MEGREINWNVIESGTKTGTTVKANQQALRELFFIPRLIHDIVEPSLESSFFGEKVRTPVMVAPLSGVIETVCVDAYLELARASERVGCTLWVGYPIEEDIKNIVTSTSSPVVQIIKPLKDRGKLTEKLKEAEKSGCRAVGIDIDSAAGIKIGEKTLPYEATAPLSMEDVMEIQEEIEIPFILKGVLSAKDARIAQILGVEGIVVSNHGGRILDTCVPPSVMLPEIRSVFEGAVFADGGFRSGDDILKGLALGAQGVLVGRPVIRALVKKAPSVVEMFENFNEELRRAMTLTGVPGVEKVPKDILTRIGGIL
jgi:isopentenyl diphosphate isomerase/L-lactate dehydrogenase-like FMN-dependent dehydrogenase